MSVDKRDKLFIHIMEHICSDEKKWILPHATGMSPKYMTLSERTAHEGIDTTGFHLRQLKRQVKYLRILTDRATLQ